MSAVPYFVFFKVNVSLKVLCFLDLVCMRNNDFGKWNLHNTCWKCCVTCMSLRLLKEYKIPNYIGKELFRILV